MVGTLKIKTPSGWDEIPTSGPQGLTGPGGGGSGYDVMDIPAGAMIINATAGATISRFEFPTNKENVDYINFTKGSPTETFVDFNVVMPETWDRSTIKVKFYWLCHTAPSSGTNVQWKIKAVSVADAGLIDAAYGTAQTVQDTYAAVDTLYISSATPALTVGGTIGVDNKINFKISRDAANANDNITGTSPAGDVWLLGILIQYNNDQTPSGW